jgi:hypothetical protein
VGLPSNGVYGGNGTKLILKEGLLTIPPVAIGATTNNLWLGTSDLGLMSFYTWLNERMRIKNNGYVGIETNDPKSLLKLNNIPLSLDPFAWSFSPMTITNPNITGTSIINDPKSIYVVMELLIIHLWLKRIQI